MPFIIIGLVVGGLCGWAAGWSRAAATITPRVAVRGVGAQPAPAPARHRRGDWVVVLPLGEWGWIECLRSHPHGCRYGVRLTDGYAVVCEEHELAR